MKANRLFIVLFIGIIVLAFTACGKSEAVIAVEEKINAIGAVSMESEPLIADAESAYNSLPEKEKADVENYAVLTAARDAYDKALEAREKELDAKVENAMRLLGELDMKAAYEAALEFKDARPEASAEIISSVDRLCYENTFICKMENVFSSMPSTVGDPEDNNQGGLSASSKFSDADALNKAFKEYYDYLNKYYILYDKSSDSQAGSLKYTIQSFYFKDINGHTIRINSVTASYKGTYYGINIVIEKDVDYRDVMDKA